MCVYVHECACVCERRRWRDVGKEKKMKVYVCGRKGVGFSDVWMTSAAEGRCVKDVPASRGPPECVCVCVSVCVHVCACACVCTCVSRLPITSVAKHLEAL